MSNRPEDAVWVDEWTEDMIDRSRPEPDGTDLRWDPAQQWVHLAAGRLGIWAAAEAAIDAGEDSDYARAVAGNRERWLVQDGQLDAGWEWAAVNHGLRFLFFYEAVGAWDIMLAIDDDHLPVVMAAVGYEDP